MQKDINGLISMLEGSVSPHHAVEYARNLLDAEGFTALEQAKPWELQRGGKYYVSCFNTMLMAFVVGSECRGGDGFRLAASHIDWPCFYIKPSPEKTEAGCLKLSIEPYGGMIFNTWLDRPLSVAGMVTLRGENVLCPERRLIDMKKPLFTIPNLAIHMNREVNKGVELNAARDLLPICRTVEKEWSKDGYFVKKLAEHMNVSADDILSYDLCLYNAEKSCFIGFDEDFLSAPRLDNITSSFACLAGISNCGIKHGVSAAILFDNEEVGSQTKQGANSSLLGMLLEKLAFALGMTRPEYIDSLMNGFMLSCDVAHAKHPNRAELSDPSCNAVMNSGVTLKMNYEQRYATEATGIGIIEGLCKKYDIPYQRFMNRPDLRGGGTLGSYASANLAMRTADIGVPMLAMHSARELMGRYDQDALNRLVEAYFAEE